MKNFSPKLLYYMTMTSRNYTNSLQVFNNNNDGSDIIHSTIVIIHSLCKLMLQERDIINQLGDPPMLRDLALEQSQLEMHISIQFTYIKNIVCNIYFLTRQLWLFCAVSMDTSCSWTNDKLKKLPHGQMHLPVAMNTMALPSMTTATILWMIQQQQPQWHHRQIWTNAYQEHPFPLRPQEVIDHRSKYCSSWSIAIVECWKPIDGISECPILFPLHFA